MTIYTNLQEFELDSSNTHQMQIVITSGSVDLECSQDNLPFTTVETFTSSLVRLVKLADTKYRFNISGTAQCSIINTRIR